VMLRITSISRWASGWIGRTPLALTDRRD
jgi:hypothetical protein